MLDYVFRSHRGCVLATVLAVLLCGVMITGCSGGAFSGATPTPYVIVLTATPPPIPSDLPTGTSPPDPSLAATASPAVVDSQQEQPPAQTSAPTATLPAPTATMQPSGPNLLENPDFEGEARTTDGDLLVARHWHPFFCAPPFSKTCRSSRAGDGLGNPGELRMERPGFALSTSPQRVASGSSAQRWFCDHRVCRGGVYQTFPTTPGEICEVGAWAHVWSAPGETGIDAYGNPTGANMSQLRTQDDRDNATWYVRVDPEGGEDPWSGSVRVSQPYTYVDGIYDQYTRLSVTFTAVSDRATVFFESTRLWPFKHNDSFVDNAFAYCRSGPTPVDVTQRVDVGRKTVVAEDLDWPISGASDIERVGDELWAFFSADGGIFHATSRDGVNWTFFMEQPLLTSRGPGSWERGGVSVPTVVYDEEKQVFHLWYQSRQDPDNLYSFGFGYATSTDGIHWTRPTRGPVITSGPAGAWDEERIDGPDAVQVGDVLRLYYSGSQLQPDLLRQIGCRASLDGINWEGCPINPVLSPRPEIAEFEGLEVEQPSIVVAENGVWLMAYTGYLGPQGIRFGIGLAASVDGLNWTRLRDDPLIPLADPDDSTTAPSLVLDEPRGLLYLYYKEAGESGPRLISMPVTFP